MEKISRRQKHRLWSDRRRKQLQSRSISAPLTLSMLKISTLYCGASATRSNWLARLFQLRKALASVAGEGPPIRFHKLWTVEPGKRQNHNLVGRVRKIAFRWFICHGTLTWRRG